MRLTRWMLILIPALMMAAPQQSGEKTAPKKKGRLTLPADAIKIDAYTHRYKDKDGKWWIYRLTPFGLVRYEDPDKGRPPKPDEEADSKPTGIRVKDLGDKVRFEKDSPFGKSTWVRKKSELNDLEKRALRESQQASAAKKAKQE